MGGEDISRAVCKEAEVVAVSCRWVAQLSIYCKSPSGALTMSTFYGCKWNLSDAVFKYEVKFMDS